LAENDPDILNDAVRRVQSGQRDAFREIVEAMLPVVRAFVAGKSLPGVDVDDVVQRTFVEAYQAIGQYQAGTHFKSWLLTIARYQLMMETTRLKRLADYHRKYVPAALADLIDNQLPSDSVEDVRLSHLRDCLKELPEHAMAVLQQRYEADQSFAKMAELLDRTEGAIRKQLFLLRQQLHDCVTRKLATEASHE
jgi:RNA polymerase sigma-70 factor (ECF subfamily)